RGGSFIDAAIAVSAVLVVTEPYASHLGGDAFCIVCPRGSDDAVAVNASGAAPLRTDAAAFGDTVPPRGSRSFSVPGLVSAWDALHRRYGRLPLADDLAQAIEYAESGFPAGYAYCRAFHQTFGAAGCDVPAHVAAMLTGLDHLPRPGEAIRQPALAHTLLQIAEGGADAFYRGPIASSIERRVRADGGWLAEEDLAAHEPDIRRPLATTYRGRVVHGQPPVSQGLILLEALNIVELWDLPSMAWNAANRHHILLEASKLAAADRDGHMGDPRLVRDRSGELVSKEHARIRAREIDLERTTQAPPPGPCGSDTTYFLAGDRDGVVSFIQSVFSGFGAGYVVPECGILMNNRMTGFSLDPASPNALAPGKRTMHTLNAYVVTHDGGPVLVGGTPGGHVQVQSNLQVLSSVIDAGLDVQRAIEAPRWQWRRERDQTVVEIEERAGPALLADLRGRGHDARPIGPWAQGSSYQLMRIDPETGAMHVGSDPRCDGQAVAF
ncbi:MAG: gamma-glutamyltransferase family protein, partial [Armatimonadetes bacterium]|nr:gamma-glutamyltransferase family protein [Armatimonadota bacterium]